MATDFHEPPHELSQEAREMRRAIHTLIEELEAVDWYFQRADTTEDEDLKQILLHNRDEEAEHAAMSLEWIRRHYPKLDEELRTYLFTTGPIVEQEEEGGHDDASPASGGDLGIGSQKGG